MKIVNILNKFVFTKSEVETMKKIDWEKDELANYRNKGIVLIDIPNQVNELVEQITYAKYFSDKFNLSPRIYYPSIHILSLKGLGSFMKYHLLPYTRGQRIARKYNIQDGLDHRVLNTKEAKQASLDAEEFWGLIKNKDDLIKYSIDEVNIGIATYDSYLRIYSKATVDMRDNRLFISFKEAIIIFYSIKKYFNDHNVRKVILGHAVYNNWKILSDYAVSKGIDVYVTYNSRLPPMHHVNENRGLQTINHMNLKKEFSSLDTNTQDIGYNKGFEFFSNRLAGKIDDGIAYMNISAYGNKELGFESFLDSSKDSIFIMLHSFYDSPHGYKEMVFPDFFEWCTRTFEFIQNNQIQHKYNIILKPHPNRIEGEDEIIEELIKRFSFLKCLNGKENNNTIIESNPKVILTVYGTVIAEFTFAGIPVIACGDNPTSSFDIAFEAHNEKEYYDLLTRIEDLKVTEKMKKEVCAFAYMYFIHDAVISFSDYPFKRSRTRDKKINSKNRIEKFKYSKFKQIIDDYFLRNKTTR